MRKLFSASPSNNNPPTNHPNTVNKVLYKCQKERNFYIQREVGDLIKSQIGVFFATKKLQKQIEEHEKNIVIGTPDSPILRVSKFRSKERQKEWDKLKVFKLRNQERMKKLAMKLEQKSINNLSKSTQNFMRISRVQERHEKMLQTDATKAIQLKKTLQISTPKHEFGRNSSTSDHLDQRIMQRVKTAKELVRVKQQSNVNTYLNKMKILESRNMSKEIKLENRKAEANKTLSKCNVALRTQKQEKLVQAWAQEYERRIERFERNRKIVTTQKEEVLMQRSKQRNNIYEQAQQRKYEADEKMAQKRITSIQNKMDQINRSPGRSTDFSLKSKSSFIHNSNKQKDQKQVEDHNLAMKKVYLIIEKLKNLKESEQLKQNEINLLLNNLNPKENSEQYQEIYAYLNSTKEKFLQQKRKEDEEKIKKNKKLNNKLL